jgi:hypothetical protein
MYRTGVMAPPDLYAYPPGPGLMTRGGPAHPVSMRSFLWAVACVLALVEFAVDLVTP